MNDIAVEAFLEDFSPERRRVANQLRDVVRRVVPDAIERVRTGWRLIGYDIPNGRRTTYFAFIWLEPEHVHLGFEYGAAMDDPDEILGGGDLRRVRFVTLVRGDELPVERLEALVEEGVRVARMSRDERAVRMEDAAR